MVKAWKKGAVIGGFWGLVSVLQAFYNPYGIVRYTFSEKIAFFPYWFEMTVIYGSPLGIINYALPALVLFVIFEGVFFGAVLGLAIEKYNQRRSSL